MFCIAVRLPVLFRLQCCCVLPSNCFFDFAPCRLLPSNCWFYFASRVCDVLPSNCWFHFAPRVCDVLPSNCWFHFATRAAKYCYQTAGFISLPELWCISIELLVSFRLQSCDIGYCHRIAGFILPPELRCTAIELLILFATKAATFCHEVSSASRTDKLCFRVLYTVIWLLVSFFLRSSMLSYSGGGQINPLS